MLGLKFIPENTAGTLRVINMEAEVATCFVEKTGLPGAVPSSSISKSSPSLSIGRLEVIASRVEARARLEA